VPSVNSRGETSERGEFSPQVAGQAQLALQVLDVLIQAEPENLEARRLRIELLEKLGSEDYCLMSRNAWVYFIERDREFLRSRGDG
jgi:alkyl sulfatase BDS1-like metallo-beta-lactamase superfamily hydrolase